MENLIIAETPFHKEDNDKTRISRKVKIDSIEQIEKKINNISSYFSKNEKNEVQNSYRGWYGENGMKTKGYSENYKLLGIISIPALIIASIILLIIFYIPNIVLINNNTEKGVGIVRLVNLDKGGNMTINKDMIKTVNSFTACIGSPGAGKSTFGSNYYKILYNVKNDYFESSEEDLTFTKGIWLISEDERRRIPQYI